MPAPQEGYDVVFVPRSGDTVGPEGSLYISDDARGTIWRVMVRP